MLIKNIKKLLLSCFMITTTYAGTPLWTIEPLTPTTLVVNANRTAVVQYRVTNNSNRRHTLVMNTIDAVEQAASGVGICTNPFVLAGKQSCILSLTIDGAKLTSSTINGPEVCEQGTWLQCYRPAAQNMLHVTQGPPILNATISVSNSPLSLIASGAPGQLTITNTSSDVTATNIVSNFTGTALDGKVTELTNNCQAVAPNASCVISYEAGNTTLAQTNFTIVGDNTNTLTAAIAILEQFSLTSIQVTLDLQAAVTASGPVSGGTGVIITGAGFYHLPTVQFDGINATAVNIVNSNTITAVTPAHPIVASDLSVDVSVSGSDGNATLPNSFIYKPTAVGQFASGGYVACLNGGLNNLIAATGKANLHGGVIWGPFNLSIPGATSNIDGMTNTNAIVTALQANNGVPYAAKLCYDYEVDSQGNSPCQAGNTCYSDWFLPSGNNTTLSGQLYCLYVNREAINIPHESQEYYWSSTETGAFPAWFYDFLNDFGGGVGKLSTFNVRCVRNFVP